MANIPVIPGTGRVQSPQIGVHANAGPQVRALGAAADAFSAGAKAVSDAAGAIAEYEVHKQKAEEVASFNQASIVLNKTTEDFRRKIPTTPDQQIIPNWTDISSKTKDEILNNAKGLTSAAQKKLSQHLDMWQSNSTIEFQVASDHLASQRRKATAMAASEQFLQSGEESFMPNAIAAIKAAQQAGDITPQEADQRIAQFPRVLQENQIRNGIEANPVATLKDIESGQFKNVPPGALLTLKRQAQAAVSHQQNAGRDDMLTRLDSGEAIDDSEIQEKEKSGIISAPGAKSIRARIKQDNLKKASDEHFNLMTEAQDHDWESDKEPDKTAQEFKDRAAALPANLREPVNRVITNKLNAVKKAGASTERPLETQVLSQMRQDRESEGIFFPSSALGEGETQYGHLAGGKKALDKMKPEEVQQLYGMSKEKVMEAEKLHYAKMQDAMRQWFKDPANQKATIEQANEYRMKLEQPFVHEAAKVALTAPTHDAEIANLLKKYGQ